MILIEKEKESEKMQDRIFYPTFASSVRNNVFIATFKKLRLLLKFNALV